MSFSPDSLKEVRIRDLSEEQQNALEKAVDMLGLERTLEGSDTLAFLAQAYKDEKQRGKSANSEALKIIEAISMVKKEINEKTKNKKEKINTEQEKKAGKAFTNNTNITHGGVAEMEIQKAYQKLVGGNKNFVEGKITMPDYVSQRLANVKGQKPYAGILYCSDSRVNVEEIFDALGGGKIFSSSVAGNIVDKGFLGSMEYAAEHLGTRLFVVLGHTMCGAVNAACGSDHAHGNLDYIVKELQPAVKAGNKESAVSIVENVKIQIGRIREESQLLSEMEKKGELKIIGGVYDIATGEVKFLE